MALTVVKNAGLAGSIDLTAKVTGTLPIANGGTNSTSTTFVNAATNVTGTLATGNGGTGSTATTFVNVASNVTGTLPAANGGTGVTSYAPGKTLQVVQQNYSTEKNRTSTAYGDTGVDCSLTPSATDSKILVICSIGEISIGNNGTTGIDMKLTRSIGASDTDLIAQITNDVGGFTTSDIYRDLPHCSFTYLDSPSSTSACQYRVYYRGNNASAYVGVQQHSSTSSITLMEIGA